MGNQVVEAATVGKDCLFLSLVVFEAASALNFALDVKQSLSWFVTLIVDNDRVLSDCVEEKASMVLSLVLENEPEVEY